MKDLVIVGPRPPLLGRLELRGGKNAALPILLTTAATPHTVVVENLPRALGDIQAANALLASIRGGLTSDATGPAIRSTPLLLTALLGQHRRASVPLPGGCAIGPRPIAAHLELLEHLGASTLVTGGRLVAEAPNGLRGATFVVAGYSTTATQLAILGAALARGPSRIVGGNLRFENRAFIAALTSLGASVAIEGDEVHTLGGGFGGGTVRVPATGDEALTWLIAGLLTGGALAVGPIDRDGMLAEAALLTDAGARVSWEGAWVRAEAGTLRAVTVRTGPPPALGSDCQPLVAALATRLPGATQIEDARFPERFQYLTQLERLGARVGRTPTGARIDGSSDRLHGADVEAPDLRGGMALVLAALSAQGETRIRHIERVERGYEHLSERLGLALGGTADV